MPITPPPLPSTPSMATRRQRQNTDAGPPSTRLSRRQLLEPTNTSLQSFLFHATEDDNDDMSMYGFSIADDRSYIRRPTLATAFGVQDGEDGDRQEVDMISALSLDDDSVYICSARSPKKRTQPQVNVITPTPAMSVLDNSFAMTSEDSSGEQLQQIRNKEGEEDELSCIQSLQNVMEEIYDSAVKLEKEAGVQLSMRNLTLDVGATSDESSCGSASSDGGSSTNHTPVEAAMVEIMADCQTKEITEKKAWAWRLNKTFQKIRRVSFPLGGIRNKPGKLTKPIKKKAVNSVKKSQGGCADESFMNDSDHTAATIVATEVEC